MEKVFLFFIYIHAGFGAAALMAGMVQLLRRKSGTVHVKTGTIYAYAVWVNALAALVLAVWHPNVFLFSIGVMSIYFVFIGQRSMRLYLGKPIYNTLLYKLLPHFALMLFGLILLIIFLPDMNSDKKPIIPMVFAVFALIMGMRNLRIVSRSESVDRNTHLKNHIGGMVGSYIFIFSAFLVVNNKNYFPAEIGWFGPSFIFVPLMTFWRKNVSANIHS